MFGLHLHLLTYFVCTNSKGTGKTACTDPEGGGGQGIWTPLKKTQNIGFLSNTGPDPLKITKLPSLNSMLGHHRHLNGVSLAGR